MNTPIQGTAADIVNRAMIRIHKRLRKLNLKAELVLYVYDELNYEVPFEELEAVYKIVSEEMTRPVTIKGIVREFKIDPEIGYSLGELGSFDPKTFKVVGKSKH
jgi:DNA polymerase I-like protein with 3'-5' exonuclease and polymerase domains